MNASELRELFASVGTVDRPRVASHRDVGTGRFSEAPPTPQEAASGPQTPEFCPDCRRPLLRRVHGYWCALCGGWLERFGSRWRISRRRF